MYTKEELEIVEYIENGHPQSVSDKENKIQLIKKAVSEKYNKRKAINIKVLESDLERIKAMALQEGMPYQTLINSVLHKFVTHQYQETKNAS